MTKYDKTINIITEIIAAVLVVAALVVYGGYDNFRLAVLFVLVAIWLAL